MTPEAQRIAIAEACGWKPTRSTGFIMDGWSHPSKGTEWFPTSSLPDYLNDLNAMHEAEKVLTPDEKTDYIRLVNKGDFGYRRLAFATATQRAEAFLRTLGFWKD